MKYLCLMSATIGVALCAAPAWAGMTPAGPVQHRAAAIAATADTATTDPSALNGSEWTNLRLLGPLNTQAGPTAMCGTGLWPVDASSKKTERGGDHQVGRILGVKRPHLAPPSPGATIGADPIKDLPGESAGKGRAAPAGPLPPETSPIPAPGAGLLAGLGLALVGWLKRRVA